MTGRAAHRNHDVPARRRLGVDHEILDDLHAVVPRRLKAERVDVCGQIEIVVDRLGHMDDAQAAGGVFGQLHRRKRRIVAADRDELRHVEPQQRLDRVLQQRRALGRVRARDPDVRPAAEMDAADAFDRQRRDMIDVPLHDPLEAVAQADDVDALNAAPESWRRR